MEQEMKLCLHTRVPEMCPECEFDVGGRVYSTQAFLESLPYEYPEEFPDFFGDGSSIRAQRQLLNEIEESHLQVSLEGFEGYSDAA